MNKMIKGLAVGLMTLGAMVGLAVARPVQGEADVAPPMYEGSAVLTKELQIPNGVTVPDVTFEFTVTEKGVESDDGTLDASRADECKPWTPIPAISFGTGDTIQNSKIEKSQDIWTIINALDFDHAGVYYYEVAEEETSYGNIIDSKAVYTVKVYVENTDSGPTVTGITVNKEKYDSGVELDPKVKVDPTPKPTHSEFRFVNKYWDVKSVQVKKLVAGDTDGDYGDRTKQFDFTIEVTLPGTTTLPYSLGYEITRADNTVESETEAFSALTQTITVSLAHNDVLEFTNLPVGSTYKVVEAYAAGYTPSATVVKNGTSDTADAAIANTDYTVAIGGDAQTFVDAGTEENSTTVTNTFKSPSVTGVIIDNLPFILMVVVAGAGITFLTISKRRRAH